MDQIRPFSPNNELSSAYNLCGYNSKFGAESVPYTGVTLAIQYTYRLEGQGIVSSKTILRLFYLCVCKLPAAV